MNKNYRRGYVFENRLVNKLKKEGWPIAFRTAGSHSPIDVVAINGTDICLIQCKAFKMSPGYKADAMMKFPVSFTDNSLVKVHTMLCYKDGKEFCIDKFEKM